MAKNRAFALMFVNRSVTTSKVLRIAALLTCHNRREMTVACLRGLRAQVLPGWSPDSDQKPGVKSQKAILLAPTSDLRLTISDLPSPNRFAIEVFLVDDGCTDGTADAVRMVWPEATLLTGDGSLFWCGGMRVAWAEAAKTDPDYYLLLNDDTVIAEAAVSELLSLAPSPEDGVIAVAPIADPETGDVVCGGHLGHAPRPVVLRGTPALCDTMNANCALVPRAVFQKIGMFHHIYTHAMGDFDYGFLATRNGVRVVQAGKVLGTSKTNSTARTWLDKSLPRRERFRLLWSSPKGLPFREWLSYTRRNMGRIWPYRCISPALRILAGR